MRMENIKRAYWHNEIGYDAAIAQLEALGMWESQADRWLFQDDDIKASGKDVDKCYSIREA